MPAFYDDVNNDGKLEYLWNYNKDKMQSLSIDVRYKKITTSTDLNAIKDNGICADNIRNNRYLKLQKLNGEPYSGFAYYGVDYSSIK